MPFSQRLEAACGDAVEGERMAPMPIAEDLHHVPRASSFGEADLSRLPAA